MSESKEDLEKQKLRQEIAELKRPSWKKPAFLSVMVAVIVPLIAAVISYFATRDSERDAEIKKLEQLNEALVQKTFELNNLLLAVERDSLESEKIRIADSIEKINAKADQLQQRLRVLNTEYVRARRILDEKESEVLKLQIENFYSLIVEYMRGIGGGNYLLTKDFENANKLVIDSKRSQDYQKFYQFLIDTIANGKSLGVQIRATSILYLNNDSAALENGIDELVKSASVSSVDTVLADLRHLADKQDLVLPRYYETVIQKFRVANQPYDTINFLKMLGEVDIVSCNDFKSAANYFYMLQSAHSGLGRVSTTEAYRHSVVALRNFAPMTFLCHVADRVIQYEQEHGLHSFNNAFLRRQYVTSKAQNKGINHPKSITNWESWAIWKEEHATEYQRWKGPDFELLQMDCK